MTLSADDLTIEQVWPSGAWRVMTIVNEYLHSMIYYGYTRKEAVDLFLSDLEDK